MAHQSDPGLAVLLALRLRSFATVDVLAATSELPVDQVSAAVELFAGDDLVRFRDGRRSGWSLTSQGRKEGERLLADEIDMLSVRHEVQTGYRAFLAENPVMLELCTDWQIRGDVDAEQPVLNQHDDAAYDASVIERLGQVHRRSQPIWQDLARTLGRFGHYDRRFEHAAGRIATGDHDWFARPSIDSYHTVWFELHENLLATLGVERSSERPEG